MEEDSRSATVRVFEWLTINEAPLRLLDFTTIVLDAGSTMLLSATKHVCGRPADLSHEGIALSQLMMRLVTSRPAASTRRSVTSMAFT